MIPRRFHNECLDLTKPQIENIEVFYCTTCHSVNKQFVTVTKTNTECANKLEVCIFDLIFNLYQRRLSTFCNNNISFLEISVVLFFVFLNFVFTNT